MIGTDWRAAVAARQAACDAPATSRGLGATPRQLTAVSLYDPRVQFAFDSAALLPSALPTLHSLAAFLRSSAGAGYDVRVEGHTDAFGTDDYNLLLSQRRAEAVLSYLTHNDNVVIARLEAIGYGKHHPLPGTNPYDGINRRVEFLLTPNGN